VEHTAINRRRFITSLAWGLPAALAFTRLTAQTPAGLIAVTPEDLLKTLGNTPIRQRYRGSRLEPVPWEDFGDAGYADAAGGVRVVTGRDSSILFGAYVVFEDEADVRDTIDEAKADYASFTIVSLPKTIDGHEIAIITYEENGQSIALVPVRNVLVIGYGGSVGDHRNNRASISHAATLMRHLLPILNRQT